MMETVTTHGDWEFRRRELLIYEECEQAIKELDRKLLAKGLTKETIQIDVIVKLVHQHVVFSVPEVWKISKSDSIKLLELCHLMKKRILRILSKGKVA